MITSIKTQGGMQLLDHGYIRFIEDWGRGEAGVPEAGIIEAARQSTQGSFRGWEDDEKLLRFLYNHKHDTPFEFAGMVLEVQAPIMVFREWHRHRTQSYNEMSARYAPLPPLYYEPTLERLLLNGATTNKQAQSSKPLDPGEAKQWLADLWRAYDHCEEVYSKGLAIGVPKELARLPMNVGHYSRMRVSANLRNWLAFMTLRCDPAAQWEIRQYAHGVGVAIRECFPHTHALWASKSQGSAK